MEPLLEIDLDKVFFNCSQLKKITKSILRDKEIKLYYAIKANYKEIVRELILNEGYGAEVLSEYELDLIKSNVPIVANGHVKSDKFLEKILERESTQLVIESIDEIENICKIYKKKKLKKNINIGVRIPFKGSRIGFDINKLYLLKDIKEKNEFLNIDMLHFHMGWNNNDNNSYKEQLELINNIHNMLQEYGIKITKWDIGGSYCEYSVDKGQLPSRMKILKSIIPDDVQEVYLEPGRFLIGDAGTLYSNVINTEGNECTVNSATYGYLLSGATPSIYHMNKYGDIIKLNIEKKSEYIICGIWPSDNDCIPIKKENINIKDKILFRNMGAYLDGNMNNISFDFGFNYKITQKIYPLFRVANEEERVILFKFWDFNNSKFKKIPKSKDMLISIINLIVKSIVEIKVYTEIELNKLLSKYFDDFATIRREMVEKGKLFKVGDNYERK